MAHVEAALWVVRVLLELHHALLHTKRDDHLCLRRNFEVIYCYHALFTALIESHILLRHFVVVLPDEFCNLRLIGKKANPDCELMQVWAHTVPKIVLGNYLE